MAGGGRAAGGGNEGGGQRRRGLNSVVVFLLNSARMMNKIRVQGIVHVMNNGWCSPPKVMETRRKFSLCLGHKISKKRVSASCEHTRQKAPKSRRLTDRLIV